MAWMAACPILHARVSRAVPPARRTSSQASCGTPAGGMCDRSLMPQTCHGQPRSPRSAGGVRRAAAMRSPWSRRLIPGTLRGSSVEIIVTILCSGFLGRFVPGGPTIIGNNPSHGAPNTEQDAWRQKPVASEMWRPLRLAVGRGTCTVDYRCRAGRRAGQPVHARRLVPRAGQAGVQSAGLDLWTGLDLLVPADVDRGLAGLAAGRLAEGTGRRWGCSVCSWR